MIRHRLKELECAVRRAIEMFRAAKQLEELSPAVLELLAQAAESERATYWTVDAALRRLRAAASWSAIVNDGSAHEAETRQRTASLGMSNAGHVWRSRKPLWSSSVVLDPMLPPALGTGLRGGVWFAVKSDTSMYGVIELLGRALEPNTPDNLFIIERLGVRLGHVLEEVRHGSARLH
jgi:hypothetical protein